MRVSTVGALVVSGAMLLAASAGVRSESTSDASAQKAGCNAAEHRQFDFWIGSWEVRDPNGKLVGRNRIAKEHGGCVLTEHWSGNGGVTGTSVNVFDRDRGKWHQTWVDSAGGLFQLDGGIVNGAMVLTGDSVDADAPSGIARQRISWTPDARGDVRQLWESSSDGGRTWNVVFDGRYRKGD